jgi:hypothetical protein
MTAMQSVARQLLLPAHIKAEQMTFAQGNKMQCSLPDVGLHKILR